MSDLNFTAEQVSYFPLYIAWVTAAYLHVNVRVQTKTCHVCQNVFISDSQLKLKGMDGCLKAILALNARIYVTINVLQFKIQSLK